MIKSFESILKILFQAKEDENLFSIFDPSQQFEEKALDDEDIARKLNASFLIILAGSNHPDYENAKDFLNEINKLPEWEDVASFYLQGVDTIHEEIEAVYSDDSDFAQHLEQLNLWLTNKDNLSNKEETTEQIYSLFFPEAAGIQNNTKEHVESLLAMRTVNITKLNDNPISTPSEEILFTSNVLLTIPSDSTPINELPYSEELKNRLTAAAEEQQLYWFDHPIQIGVELEKNEIIYGLQQLDQSIEVERDRNNIENNAKLTCLLSVSVTHKGLQGIAGQYIKEELSRIGGLKNIDVYIFTEEDTQRIIDDVLSPAAEQYLAKKDASKLLNIFGVDGEYGRHYSFLKAISAFWQIFINPKVRATFKIDLDQVFPQKELVEETGASAFEHLMTPLWGAQGTDRCGRTIELGLIAGALVNERDIHNSIFTRDVNYPKDSTSPDEAIFFSPLPQALSTEVEMMTRYNSEKLDGKNTCIQRVHVTGGTNGILIDTLRKYRPFTPSFLGRAEDQAYILSVLLSLGEYPGYVHKDGLIMRHDKEAFAQEAIESAYIGKVVGDYIRILYFSEYARVLTDSVSEVKERIDPFTGCFVSKIPTTIVYLRFVLKAASFFNSDRKEDGLEFIIDGTRRILSALKFTEGENSTFKKEFEKEHIGWNLYYDIISAFKDNSNKGDAFTKNLHKKASDIINQCSYYS